VVVGAMETSQYLIGGGAQVASLDASSNRCRHFWARAWLLLSAASLGFFDGSDREGAARLFEPAENFVTNDEDLRANKKILTCNCVDFFYFFSNSLILIESV
jgi:hypothetical protein